MIILGAVSLALIALWFFLREHQEKEPQTSLRDNTRQQTAHNDLQELRPSPRDRTQSLLRGLAPQVSTGAEPPKDVPADTSPFASTQGLIFPSIDFGGGLRVFAEKDRSVHPGFPLVEVGKTPTGEECLQGFSLLSSSRGKIEAPVDIAWIVERSASHAALVNLEIRMISQKDCQQMNITLYPRDCIAQGSLTSKVSCRAGQLVYHRSSYLDPDQRGAVVLIIEQVQSSAKIGRSETLALSSKALKAHEAKRGVMPGAKTMQVGPASLTVMPGQ